MHKKFLLLLIFSILLFFAGSARATDSIFCGPGGTVNNPPLASAPTYDYGPDGLLRFHFKMLDEWSSGGAPYIISGFSYPDCRPYPLSWPYENWVRSAFYFPNVPNLMLKVEPFGADTFHFVAYDEDTNQPAPFSGALPIVKIGDILGITFVSWSSDTAFYYNIDRTEVDTPGVSVAGPGFNMGKTPVLIIPGVLGTDINKSSEKLWLNLGHNFSDVGDEFMDPLQFKLDLTPVDSSLNIGEILRKPSILFDYAEGLIQELQSQGYTQGTNLNDSLFLFPYDWRYGVSGKFSDGRTNVDLLKEKIQDIMAQTGSDKVDVVAHSTGGLLVKKYVMDHPGDNHIGKAVFVGVPNTGAPKAVKVLLQGDSFGIPWLADLEMQKLSQNFPIVYDLSPSRQYYNAKGSYIKVINQGFISSTSQDLNFNQANNFLTNDHHANSQALTNAQNLHTADFDNFDMRANGVDVYAINGCKAGTIGKVIERHSSSLLGGVSITYDQPQETPGDGTVPLESATNLPIDPSHKYYALKADHGKMPSQEGIRQQIVNIVSGSSLSTANITQDIGKCKLKGKAVSVYSPVNISITDQDGMTAGLTEGGVQNSIPNADFEIFGDHKFVYLPTDEGQTYTVKIDGTGSGTFTLKDEDINDNQVSQTQVFSNLPVTAVLKGQVNFGTTTTLALDKNGDGVVDQTVQPSSVINAEQSQDFIPPVSTSTFTGLMGQPGFYRSNVSVRLSAKDPVVAGQESQTSGILKVNYNVDNQGYQSCAPSAIWGGSGCSMVVIAEGQHIISFFSTDKAGNNEPEQRILFVIDKTLPEFVIQFNPSNKDLQFEAIDAVYPRVLPGLKKALPFLPGDLQTKVLDNDDVITASDQAGNITKITLKDKNRKRLLKAEIKSIAYNGALADLSKNLLAFDWKPDNKQNIIVLNQHAKSKKDFNIDAHYENGKTSIAGKDQTGKINKILNGVVLLKVTTSQGDLSWGY